MKRGKAQWFENLLSTPVKAEAAPGVLEFVMMNNGLMSENAVIQTKRPRVEIMQFCN